MTKKIKIIYIHQRPYPYNQTFYEEDSDFYFYFGEGALYDIHKPIEMRDLFEIEIWRPEVGIKAEKSKIVNGALCRIFPAIYWGRVGTISFDLIKEINNQVKNKNVLIHYTATPHNYEFYLISFLFGKKVPIFVSHQGGPNPLYKLSKRFRLGTYISFIIEKFISDKVCMYFSGSIFEIEYLKLITNETKIYELPHWGIDLSLYKPIDKTVARKKLNLPNNKKIILTFGKLNKYRGIKNSIKVRDILSKEYDVVLLNVGSDPSCPDYQYAKENGVILRGIVPAEEISYYFSAGDVYLYLTEGDENFRFAGTGIAPLEALACNTPIVTNTLHNFPFIDWKSVGYYATTVEEAVKGVKSIFDNPNNFSNTRMIIEKYFDWRIITKNIFNMYLKYFDNKQV